MIGIRPPGEPGHRADSSAAGSTRRHFRTSHQPSVEPLARTADQACSPRRRQHRRAVRSHGGVLEASATPGSGPPGGTGLRSVRGRWRSKPLTLNPLTARRSGSGAEAWGRRMSAAKVPWPRLVAQHGEPPPGRRSRVDRPPPQCVGWDTSRACRTWASKPASSSIQAHTGRTCRPGMEHRHHVGTRQAEHDSTNRSGRDRGGVPGLPSSTGRTRRHRHAVLHGDDRQRRRGPRLRMSAPRLSPQRRSLMRAA